jgi:autonomous glycyl radical cofactor GrcA
VSQVLGRGSSDERAGNLATVLDGYFVKGGHHVNINVLNRDMLEDAVQVRADDPCFSGFKWKCSLLRDALSLQQQTG